MIEFKKYPLRIKAMDKILISIFVLAFLGGCTKLEHLDQLLTLKSLSDDQTQQKKYVESQNKKFEALLKVVKNNELNKYPDKKSILEAFGEPIFSKTVYDDEEVREEWLYRYSEKLSGSEKVYLYFNTMGRLVNWRHFLPETNKEKSADKGG